MAVSALVTTRYSPLDKRLDSRKASAQYHGIVMDYYLTSYKQLVVSLLHNPSSYLQTSTMSSTMSSTSPNNSVAYTNGRVFTINSQAPWAEAFIVAPDGTFVQVGTTAEVEARARQEHLVTFDLRGQFVMPGIHDAHVHMLMSAIAITSQTRLPMEGLNATNVAEELKKGSCLCKYAHINQDWLVAHAYMVEGFNRECLDEAYPDTPVVIRGGAAHSAFLNTEALKRTGYDIASEPDSQGAWYQRDEQGRLTGEMAENAMNKVLTQMPQPGLPHVKRVLKEAQYMLHRAGVTSCQEASANTLMLNGLRELEQEGVLKLDMYTHIVYAPDVSFLL